MPRPDIRELVKAPGFLYKNPSSLTDPSNYGTPLGYTVSGISAYINPEIAYLKNEEYGNNIWKKFFLGNTTKIVTLLRNYNADALSVPFDKQTTSTGVRLMGGYSPGDEMTNAMSIIYIPNNLSYPCVYIKNASPNIFPGKTIEFGHSAHTVFPTVIDALPGSEDDGSYFQIEVIGGIVL